MPIREPTTEVPGPVRQLAAQRLTDLTGENVLPLPQRISDVAVKHLPRFLLEVQKLPQQVAGLGLPEERLSRLQSSITNALMGDGSNSAMIFGAAEANSIRTCCGRVRSKKPSTTALPKPWEISPSFSTKPDAWPARESCLIYRKHSKPKGAKRLSESRTAPSTRIFPHSPILLRNSKPSSPNAARSRSANLLRLSTAHSSLRSSSDFKKLAFSRQAQLEQRLSEIIFQPEPTLQGLAKAQTNFTTTATELQSIREEVEKAAVPPQLITPVSG